MTVELEPLTEQEVLELDAALGWPLAHEDELLSAVEKRAGVALDATSSLRLRSACRLIADCEPATAEALVDALNAAQEEDPKAEARKAETTMTDDVTFEKAGELIAVGVHAALDGARKRGDTKQAMDVLTKTLDSSPEAANAYRSAIAEGRGGAYAEQIANEEERKAETIRKADSFPAFSELMAKAKGLVEKSAGAKMTLGAALEAVIVAPENKQLCEDYLTEMSSRARGR